MVEGPPPDLASLKRFLAFRELPDEVLTQFVGVSTTLNLNAGESLVVGPEETAAFYLVLDGKLRLRGLTETGEMIEDPPNKKPFILRPGEFFGAGVILFYQSRPVHATAVEPVRLMKVTVEPLILLLKEQPMVRHSIIRTSVLSKLMRSDHFEWLGPDELIQFIAHEHSAYLLVRLVFPFLLSLGGLLTALAAVPLTSIALSWILLAVGLGVAVAGLALIVWRYFDWNNDYFIITDQRVVWLEQVILLYDSRRESPLSAIKSTTVETDLLGRLLGYGTVTIFTFLGKLPFRNVRDPHTVKTIIDNWQKQANQRMQKSNTQAMERAIRRKIDPTFAAAQSAGKPASEQVKAVTQAAGFWQDFSDYFKTRFENGDIITYRKHIIMLLRKVWVPSTLEIVLLTIVAFALSARIREQITFPSIPAILLMTFLVSIVFIVWWVYQYLDWRDDIYQITPDKLVDTIKHPLGDEVTKSAALSNVQSLDYNRIGIIGLLLNYGDVVINVGAEKPLLFNGIHDPARAQQDIFNRLFESQNKKALAESAKQWEQVSDWLAAYHRQAEEMRRLKDLYDPPPSSSGSAPSRPPNL